MADTNAVPGGKSLAPREGLGMWWQRKKVTDETELIVGGPHAAVTVSHRTEAARGARGSAHPAAPSGDPGEVESDRGQLPSRFLSSRASDTSLG